MCQIVLIWHPMTIESTLQTLCEDIYDDYLKKLLSVLFHNSNYSN